MVSLTEGRGLVTESSLEAFFHDSVHQAIHDLQVDAEESTVHYLVHLLTRYSRSEHLFDHTPDGRMLRPLAQLYADAVEASSGRERRLMLQRLGDVALFIAGLFSGSLARKPVDVGYYIAMGGSAYAYLFENAWQTPRDQALASTFRELSRGFTRFVDVLAEVGEQACGGAEDAVLRLYEAWTRTQSPRLERRLRRLGVVPMRSARAH